jgi:hypothetical protein
MKTLRQKLLRWFPVLGSAHKRLHALAEKWNQGRSILLKGINLIRFDLIGETRIRTSSKVDRDLPATAGSDAARRPASTSGYLEKFNKPVVHLYSVCWNQAEIIPYFMNYYSDFVDSFYIHDNMSSDSTPSLLAHYDNVTVIPYDTGNTFNDAVNQDIKNTAWKQSRGKADFVIVCDMDEFLYHPHMLSLLRFLKKDAFTLVKPHGYDMVSTALPAFNGTQKITELIRNGVYAPGYLSKTLLFSPELESINYSPGCHKSDPEGRIKPYESKNLKLLHYKFIDRNSVLSKTKQYRSRLSAINKKHGWGGHYIKPDEQILAEFDYIVSQGKKVI